MPKIVTRLARQLAARGVKNATGMAFALMQKRGMMKGGKMTAKGMARNKMTPAMRAKDRAMKATGKKHKMSEYNYSSKTNRATLKTSKRK